MATAAGNSTSISCGRTRRTVGVGRDRTAGSRSRAAAGTAARRGPAPTRRPGCSHRPSTASDSPTSDEHSRGWSAAAAAKAATAAGLAWTGMRLAPSQQMRLEPAPACRSRRPARRPARTGRPCPPARPPGQRRSGPRRGCAAPRRARCHRAVAPAPSTSLQPARTAWPPRRDRPADWPLVAERCRYIVNTSSTDWRQIMEGLDELHEHHEHHGPSRTRRTSRGADALRLAHAVPAAVGRTGRLGHGGPGGGFGPGHGRGRGGRGRRPNVRAAVLALLAERPDARVRDDHRAGDPHRRRLAAQPRLGLPHPAAAGGRGADRQRGGRRPQAVHPHRRRPGRGRAPPPSRRRGSTSATSGWRTGTTCATPASAR